MTQKYILRCFLENELGDYCDEFEMEFSDEKQGMSLFNRCKFEYERYRGIYRNQSIYLRENI